MGFGIIATELLNCLLTAGLARVGTLAFHKVARINRIEQEIKAGLSQDRPIARALNDLQIVLGRCYGPYTTDLHSFFAELQRSGIVNVLAEEAALAKKHPISEGLFIQLYKELLPDEEPNPEKLFDVVYKCFRASLTEQVGDKSLAFLVRSLDGTINKRIEALKHTISTKNAPSTVLGPAEYLENLRKMTRGLQSLHKNIRVDTNRGARMVDINRVFIPSKIRSAKMSEKEGIAGGFLITRHPESPAIEYKAFRQAFQRVVVLGDPGGGKSTLCQYLCYELSKHVLLGAHTASGGGLEYQLQKIPLRVVLRTFEKARKSEPQLDMFSFVCREIRNSTTLPIERSRAPF